MADLLEAIRKHPLITRLVILAGVSVDVCSQLRSVYSPPPAAYECLDAQDHFIRYHRSSMGILGEGKNLRLYVIDDITSRPVFAEDLQRYECFPIP